VRMRNTRQFRAALESRMAERHQNGADVARATGLTAPTISRIRNGKTEQVDERTIDCLAGWFGMSVPDLQALARGDALAPAPAATDGAGDRDAELDELAQVIAQLSPQQQECVLAVARQFLADERRSARPGSGARGVGRS